MLLSNWITTWFSTYCAQRKPATLTNYQSITSRIICPSLGQIDLADLQPEDIQQTINAQLALGHTRQAQLTFSILHAALDRATKTRRLAINPCDLLDKPTHRTMQARALTPDEQTEYRAAGELDPLWPAYAMMLYAGLRRGEVIALRWRDIDLPGRVLHVRRSAAQADGKLVEGSPKSAAGVRDIPLCDYLTDTLAAHRRASLRAGRIGADRLVIPGRNGLYVSPTTLYKHHSAILEAAHVLPTTLHGLRRTFGTRISQRGVSLKTLQTLMGHSTVTLSMQLYNEAQSCYIYSDFSAHCAQM